MKSKLFFAALACLLSWSCAQADELKVGDPAPIFTAKTQDGAKFDLALRKGQWTVLYFYPKAETPGCTKQACAYRDSIEQIRKHGAEVYGISADTVEAQASFHKAHHLNFTLLADPDGKVIGLYGTKMPIIRLSRRWTFIVDPELKIRSIDKGVDPVMDARIVTKKISALIGP
ncbi:MAG: peroxiredoxin [Oligoflexia bacterium]|nr:peroxiredoxin [Oligoflexia bacterium]